MDFTLIIPYYRSPKMLRKQLDFANLYPKGIKVIVIDDGSPEPAIDVFKPGDKASLYRIKTDIPWNRGGARNLGTYLSETLWILHVDIDHVLTIENAQKLVAMELPESMWYKFRRFRIGAADFTRNKDEIPRDQKYGEIKPHIDSYLCTQELFWRAGGYDEDYSGCLGGGSPFLKQMMKEARCKVLQKVRLHVFTTDVIEDASITMLSRDKTEYKKRLSKKGYVKAKNHMRFEWEKVL